MIVKLKTDTDMEICRFADELSSAGIAFENLQLVDGIWQLDCTGDVEPRVLAVLDAHKVGTVVVDVTVEIKKSELDSLQEQLQMQDATLNDLLFTILPEMEGM